MAKVNMGPLKTITAEQQKRRLQKAKVMGGLHEESST